LIAFGVGLGTAGVRTERSLLSFGVGEGGSAGWADGGSSSTTMTDLVLGIGDHLKVGEVVVLLVAIAVMNDLIGLELSSDGEFDDQPMNWNEATTTRQASKLMPVSVRVETTLLFGCIQHLH